MKPRTKKTPGKRTAISRSKNAKPGNARPALHENPWFSIRKRGKFYTIEYRQAQTIILPVVDNRGVVLVRVKRPVINDTPLELPAGGIEAGESPAAGAARELSEETGITISDISRFIPLPALSPSPNRTPTRLHVFRVDLTQNEFSCRGPHDDEITGVEFVPLAELAGRIIHGDIYVAVPVAVLATFLLSGTNSPQAASRPQRKSPK